jgi:hypothetical protein
MKETRVMITARVPPTTRAQLNALAVLENVSTNRLMRALIDERLAAARVVTPARQASAPSTPTLASTRTEVRDAG